MPLLTAESHWECKQIADRIRQGGSVDGELVVAALDVLLRHIDTQAELLRLARKWVPKSCWASPAAKMTLREEMDSALAVLAAHEVGKGEHTP